MSDRVKILNRGTGPRPGKHGEPWYRIENKSKANSAEVYIYDEIGLWGIGAAEFVRELNALNVSTIELHLNSVGGEVFDGIAIHNALAGHKATVNVIVDGIAASIASVIAMAGDSVAMNRGSQMMIHEASGLCMGNAADMRQLADLLDRASENIANFYVGKAGGTITSWRDAMRVETWYSADEAVAAGLADEVVAGADDGAKARASLDLSAFRYPGREVAPAPALPPIVDNLPVPDPIADEPEPDPAMQGEPAEVLDAPIDVLRDALSRAFMPEDLASAFDPEIFRQAMALAANDAPAPPRPTPGLDPEPDPVVTFDAVAFRRAVEGAML